MKTIFLTLCQDDCGFVVSMELVLVSTIAVLGLVVGLAEIRQNTVSELEDVGSAMGSLQQSYSYSNSSGHGGIYLGTNFSDASDFCDQQNDIQP